MNDEQMMLIYEWIDSIPLSREKKNINRDFCDGALLAEIIKYYRPKIVELHNYPSASSTKQKLSNWNTLCLKVFKKLKFTVTQNEINEIVNCKPNAIEKLLFRLYYILMKKNYGNTNDNQLLLGVSSSDDATKIKEEINKVQNVINELNYKKNTILETIDRLNGESLVYKRKIEELKQQEENMKSQQ
jgi:hypothetical protein